MANLKDIAKIAGLDCSTVSRALKHHPKINPRTIKRVESIALDLGYLTPSQKRFELSNSKILSNKRLNICLLFPYNFVEYKYTSLDLLMIDVLEKKMQARNGILYATRLNINGDLPSYFKEIGLDGIIVKSAVIPPKKTCPRLYELPVVSVFGFHTPPDKMGWVTDDSKLAIEKFWREIVIQNKICDILFIYDKYHDHQNTKDKWMYLQIMNDIGIATLSKLDHSVLDEDRLMRDIMNFINSSKHIPILYFCRESGNELRLAENILRQNHYAHKRPEILIETYSRNTSDASYVNWLDLKGAEIIENSLDIVLNCHIKSSSKMLIAPELILKRRSMSMPNCLS